MHQNICKHFAHKVASRCDESNGTVALGFGETTFKADATTLSIQIALNSDSDPQSSSQMIGAHLGRFAFREDFKTMVWSEI